MWWLLLSLPGPTVRLETKYLGSCTEGGFVCGCRNHFIPVQVTSKRRHAVPGLQTAECAGAPSDSSLSQIADRPRMEISKWFIMCFCSTLKRLASLISLRMDGFKSPLLLETLSPTDKHTTCFLAQKRALMVLLQITDTNSLLFNTILLLVIICSFIKVNQKGMKVKKGPFISTFVEWGLNMWSSNPAQTKNVRTQNESRICFNAQYKTLPTQYKLIWSQVYCTIDWWVDWK